MEPLAGLARLEGVTEEYSDGVSASRFGTKVRRGWKRLLSDLDAGLLDVVITWEPSRADRDLETWVAFVAKCRAKGVLIHITVRTTRWTRVTPRIGAG